MLLETTNGLYCPDGDFHVDPWGAVPRAVITHAHGDHARAGSDAYFCSAPTCAPFEPVRCDTFVTESTFGLPIFRWDPTAVIIAEILAWWDENRNADRASVLFCYTRGKAQRLLAELAAVTDRPVLAHGMMHQGELVPIAKAYSGLSNEEIAELDRWIRQHTRERFGPVRHVEPVHVFELGFEAIAESPRHKSGIAVRFPRMLRWRKDKPASEADTLENVRRMLGHAGSRLWRL